VGVMVGFCSVVVMQGTPLLNGIYSLYRFMFCVNESTRDST
jgi:hypothetical protein